MVMDILKWTMRGFPLAKERPSAALLDVASSWFEAAHFWTVWDFLFYSPVPEKLPQAGK